MSCWCDSHKSRSVPHQSRQAQQLTLVLPSALSTGSASLNGEDIPLIEWSNMVRAAYSSYANFVTKSSPIGSYWPYCCWSHSESRSRCCNSRLSVAINVDEMFTISFPNCTPLPSWWEVLMNITSYVDNLMDRCSFSALVLAASEWIRAWDGQLCTEDAGVWVSDIVSSVVSCVFSFVGKSIVRSITDDASAEQVRRRRLRGHGSSLIS